MGRRVKGEPGWRGGDEKNWQWRTLCVKVGPVACRLVRWCCRELSAVCPRRIAPLYQLNEFIGFDVRMIRITNA